MVWPDLLAETVDANLAGRAHEARRRITLVSEVAIRAAHLVIARNGRHGLADVELQVVADHRVWRGARDVAVVVQADAADGAGVLHAVGAAHEERGLAGYTAVFNPHLTDGTHALLAARNAGARDANLGRAHAIVRDGAALDRERADAEARVATVAIDAIVVGRAGGRALSRHALVVRRALRLIRTLIHGRGANAADARVSDTRAAAIGVFAARQRIDRDAPVRRAGIPKDATDHRARPGLARTVRSAGFSCRTVRGIAAVNRRRRIARAARRTARRGRTAGSTGRTTRARRTG